MPVSIRLSRFGRKDLPFYRVVVVDSRKKRDGEFLETIGTYDGLKTKLVTFKPERFDAWVKLGAQPSDTAKKLYLLFKK
ncbi:30S ribosomal protein S16 [Candidatus Dependentiae bacterium]|nr:MAG: 30S ribosomal protein S16 [Candidatus Dependentiae bacterium]